MRPVDGLRLAAGLVLGCSAAACAERVLRVAHVNLDPPVRAAFDEVARDFEALRPGVRVEQLPVPLRIYHAWQRTQLVGGTPPDLMELLPSVREEDLVQYYRDLTPELFAPNPHNAGTELAGRPWRETFVTNLGEKPNFIASLLRYYSVPSSVVTWRLVYNETLLRDEFGIAAPPRTVAELAEQCDRIVRLNRERGLNIVPLVAENWKGRALLMGIARSATASLQRALDPLGSYYNWDDEIAAAFLLGRWSFETPAWRDALAQMRAAGRHLPGGFLQLADGDASFKFIQGRAVFFVAVSREFTNLLDQCRFSLGVADLPRADSAGARPIAEGNVLSLANLAIPHASRQPDLALDFMRFLTSQAGNRRFADRSRWLPAVQGVAVAEELASLSPNRAGDPPGFAPWMIGPSGTDMLINRELHTLLNPGGSVESFLAAIGPQWRGSLVGGLRRMQQNNRRLIEQLDVILGARDRLETQSSPVHGDAGSGSAGLFETLAVLELQSAYYDLVLAGAEHGAEAVGIAPLPVAGSLSWPEN